jgi:hypothetical protein
MTTTDKYEHILEIAFMLLFFSYFFWFMKMFYDALYGKLENK